MLSLLRHLFIDSWLGRIIVGLVFVVFICWGGADVWTNYSHQRENVVTTVGDKVITMQQLGNAYKQALNNLQNDKKISDISTLSNGDKRIILNNVLSEMINNNALLNNAPKLGVVVSDADIRKYIFSQPFFQVNGQYNEAKLKSILDDQQISLESFVQDTKDTISKAGTITPIAIGGTASPILIDQIFQFNNQTRSVAYIKIPFNYFNIMELPSNSDLKRFYDNHTWLFQVPEFRHVRMIMLSPESIARGITITDQEARQYYDLSNKEYNQPEKRNVQLITFKDEKSTQVFIKQWDQNISWSNIQNIVQKDSGVPVEMNGIRETAFPIPSMGKVIFDSQLNKVSLPIKTPSGWTIFKVVAITPAKNVSFDSVEKDIKEQLALQKAKAKLSANVKELQDILAGGSGFDKIFSDLGVVGVEGKFDQNGLTQDGEVAPLPYKNDLKKKILIDMFSTAKNLPPSLKQGQDNTFYAFIVDDIIPTHQATFDEVKDNVLKLWKNNNLYRQANVVATALLDKAHDTKQGVFNLKTTFRIEKSADFSRINLDKKIPKNVLEKSFEMNVSDTTMIQGGGAFYVLTLLSIDTPKINKNNQQYKQLMLQYSQSVQGDILQSYVNNLNKKFKLSINQKALDVIVQSVN